MKRGRQKNGMKRNKMAWGEREGQNIWKVEREVKEKKVQKWERERERMGGHNWYLSNLVWQKR